MLFSDRKDTSLFQFHKGTSKTGTAIGAGIGGLVFQFHKGTSKTISRTPGRRISLRFQFHKGTSKTWCSFQIEKIHLCFNSIKVRVKLVLLSEQVLVV